MKISIIVAIAENNAIGYNNQLLCYLPNDLKWFKKNTNGRRVIMGRNTFLSLPNGALPNRENIVITDKAESFENCKIVNSLEQAILNFDLENENFIIGGASIYKQFLPMANKLYITKIKHNFEADAFFPEIDLNLWKLVEKIENKIDEKHNFEYDFLIYEKY